MALGHRLQPTLASHQTTTNHRHEQLTTQPSQRAPTRNQSGQPGRPAQQPRPPPNNPDQKPKPKHHQPPSVHQGSGTVHGQGAMRRRPVRTRSLRGRPQGTSTHSQPVPEEPAVRNERTAPRRAAATVQRRNRACCFHTRTVWPGCRGGENSDWPRGSRRISHWASGGLFGSGSTW